MTKEQATLIRPVSRARPVAGLAAAMAVAGAITLVPLAFYLPFLSAPFERDEGVYATLAQGLLDGKVPYRDLFDNKPPLTYAWYALSFLAFGEHTFAPRLIAGLLLSLTALVVYAQARLVFAEGLARLAALLFGASAGVRHVGLHANTEAFMMLPLMASLWAFTRGIKERDGYAWFALAGALGGLALMTKQVAVWNLLAFILFAAWWRWRAGRRGWRALLPPVYLVAGAAATVGVVVVPFVIAGTLDDLAYANIAYNSRYVGVVSYAERIFRIKRALLFGLFFLGVSAPFVAGSVAGLFRMLRNKLSLGDYLLVLWTAASAIGVAMGGRFYPHYFLQLTPAMAALTAVAVYRRLHNAHIAPVRWYAFALAASLVAVSLATNAVLWFAPREAEQRLASDVYNQKLWEEASPRLAEYIRSHTGPGEEIFNYGREAQLYFYADRPPAVRYFYDWAYGYDPATLPETLRSLQANPPRYVIDTVLPPLFEEEDRLPQMDEFLRQNYAYAGREEFADVHVLKSESSTPGTHGR